MSETAYVQTMFSDNKYITMALLSIVSQSAFPDGVVLC